MNENPMAVRAANADLCRRLRAITGGEEDPELSFRVNQYPSSTVPGLLGTTLEHIHERVLALEKDNKKLKARIKALEPLDTAS